MDLSALQIPGLWRGSSPRPAAALASTGSAALDQALGGGWPVGALTQIIGTAPGLGFSLIIPALAACTAAGRAVALIDPPYLPYAPALAAGGVELPQLLWLQPQVPGQAQWAAEQVARSGLFAALACWGALDGTAERRLQLAAAAAPCLVFCFRTGRADGHSLAALRLAVAPAAEAQLQVQVLKCRGRPAGHRLLHRCDAPPVAA